MGSNAASGNTRQIAFLETSPWKSGHGGVTTNSTIYEDPWGNPYYAVVDANYTNGVSVTYGSQTGQGSTTVNLQKTVAVYNIQNSAASSSASNYYLQSVTSF
jgi:hypothetical protein